MTYSDSGLPGMIFSLLDTEEDELIIKHAQVTTNQKQEIQHSTNQKSVFLYQSLFQPIGNHYLNLDGDGL